MLYLQFHKNFYTKLYFWIQNFGQQNIFSTRIFQQTTEFNYKQSFSSSFKFNNLLYSAEIVRIKIYNNMFTHFISQTKN